MKTRGFRCCGVAFTAICLLLAGGAANAIPTVKVSLSPEDPNVHTQEHLGDATIAFHVFVDGMTLRGAEFGLAIQGGEFVEYNIDTKKVWISLPIPDPYPGTIAQAGVDCYEPPVYFGKVIVKPTRPGEPIVVDAIPSERARETVFQKCDFSATNGFVAYAAAVNRRPPPPHEVSGVEVIAGPRAGPVAGPEPPPRPERTPGEEQASPVETKEQE